MTQICCPVCRRDVNVDINLDDAQVVSLHLDTMFHRCEMSCKPVPSALLREIRLEQTASRVLQLAADLRDDIEDVWAAVDNASPAALREWLLIALAAVDVDHEPSKLFGWIEGVAA